MKLHKIFNNSSIRVRLSLLIAMNSGIALTLAGIGLFGYEGYEQRLAETRQLSAQAGIISGNSLAALSFADDRAATETLAALRGDSRLIEAVIYDRNNKPFASYHRSRLVSAGSPSPRPEGIYFESGTLLLFQPIMQSGERIGTILLRSNDELFSLLRRYVGIVCLVLTLSLGLALVLGSRMQRTIAEPIAGLSEMALRISASRDYSVRAPTGPGGEIGILIDSFNHMLSKIKASEESLRESEERYALAARGANDGLWDWKLTTGKIYFSPRWYGMLGESGDDKWSDPEEWFSRIHKTDRERVRAEVAGHLEGKTPELVTEYRMRHNRGDFVWMLTRGIVVRDPAGTAIRVAGSQTDITEGKVADPLTGLPNRLYLIDKLEASLDRAQHQGDIFALLFLDLDRFKLVNDSLGHAAGDELLMGVAGRLRSSVRAAARSAQLGPSVIARLGGDEFAILLSGLEDQADAAVVAQRIVGELDTPFSINGRQVLATVSIGVAMGSSANAAEDILRNADTAMYYAKAKGKARFEIFDDRMRERAVARLDIETGLRKAIEAGELTLYYQAEVSVRNQRVVGYEALVRWNHPQRGILGPGEFVPVAEESDLIVQLGRWVLRQACTQMAQWQRTVVFDPPLSVSVNIAPRQLSDPQFVRDVERVLAETGLNPKCLKLEMTESSIMVNPETTLETLRRLKLLGVGLEIDDFGTGYSSLSYLQKLPFDTVKVDRSFVKEMNTSPESLEIVKTILDLARSLEMSVVAEGVETGDQLETLSGLGCNCVQGFYFSRPAGSDATLAVIRERKQLEQDFQRIQNGLSGVDPITSAPPANLPLTSHSGDVPATWDHALAGGSPASL